MRFKCALLTEEAIYKVRRPKRRRSATSSDMGHFANDQRLCEKEQNERDVKEVPNDAVWGRTIKDEEDKVCRQKRYPRGMNKPNQNDRRQKPYRWLLPKVMRNDRLGIGEHAKERNVPKIEKNQVP
jgi:hypothetical protein